MQLAVCWPGTHGSQPHAHDDDEKARSAYGGRGCGKVAVIETEREVISELALVGYKLENSGETKLRL